MKITIKEEDKKPGNLTFGELKIGDIFSFYWIEKKSQDTFIKTSEAIALCISSGNSYMGNLYFLSKDLILERFKIEEIVLSKVN